MAIIHEGTRLTVNELADCLTEMLTTLPDELNSSVLKDAMKYVLYIPTDQSKRRWTMNGTHVAVEIIRRLRSFGYSTTGTPAGSILKLKYNPDIVLTNNLSVK